MKRKTLIQLIKSKANEVEIKDFSASILEKAKHLPREKVATFEKTKMTWHLKPFALAATFVFVLILGFALFYDTAQTPPITQPTLDQYDDAIALSAMSSASLVTLVDQELSQPSQSNILLLSSVLEHSYAIDTEVNEVTKYLEMIEKLLSNQHQFEVKNEKLTTPGHNRKMQFTTKDLLDHEVEYTMSYLESYDEVLKKFTLNGHLLIGDQTIQMSAVVHEEDKAMIFKVAKDSENFVELIHTMHQEVDVYTIQVTKHNEVTSVVTMTISGATSEKSIELNFVQGVAIGRYSFTKDIEDQKPIIKVSYVIQGESTDQGELIVRITHTDQGQYNIVIQPIGRPSYITDRIRGFSENRGRAPITPNP